jgi:uncharacterized YccA/Bax inhibitor family protein
VRSSNPVLTRLTPETQRGTPAQSGYGTPAGYGAPPPYESQITTAVADRMTIDDVVVKTVALLGLLAISGIATAALIQDERTLWTAVAISGIAGLVIGLVVTFKRMISVPLIVTYALVEGVFVGGISKAFEANWPGIVVQAVVATFGVFFVMAALYKFRVIRATPKFAKGLLAALAGVLVLIVGNLIISLFTGENTPLRQGGAIGIGFSIVVIVIAALTFILDFDLIERSIEQGAPKQVAWLCAFGLVVGLIWLYLEILRLLSYLRGDN